MRLRLAAVSVLILAGTPASGSAQQALSLGILAGADVADQAGADVFTPHDRFGFIGGVSAAFHLSSRWSVQVDALYDQKGGRENNDRDPGDPVDELSIGYIEVPILLKFSFSEVGTRPELFVGPSFAFEQSCTFDVYPGGESDPAACPDAGLETRSPDIGIAFGADVEIPLGSGHLVIDARGVVGLGSFDDSAAELDFRNRILALMVGYRFGL